MPSNAVEAAARTGKTRRPIGRLLLGAAVLVGLVLLGREAGPYVPRFAQWVEGLGVWGPIIFITGYAAAVVAFVPASFLSLAAGAIFGLVEGCIYVFVAATLGASVAFLVSRNFARAAIERRIAGERRFAAIDRAVGAQGRRIVFLLRLSPAIPFNLLNYALGLTPVRFRDYLIASVGMIPGTLLYVYSGKLAGDVAALGASPDRGAAYYAVLVLGLAATLVVTIYVTRMARRALREATGA
jgi:uncharacterized membrane protein YdjX (TVP38/TMEM64 family)